MGNLLIFGHRGAAGIVAENTLESIEAALNEGVEGVEIDVHRCETGELVVIHDTTVDRTTDGTGKVSKLSLENLQKLKIEGRYQIPTLQQVLELINGKCLLNIELKGKKTIKSTIKAVQECVKSEQWTQEHFLISSFDWQQLQQARKLDPEIRLGVLTENKLKSAFKLAKKIGAYAIHPDHKLLRRYHMWRAKRRGFKVFPWTVNTDKEIKRLQSYGVDGIITDYPDRYANI